MTDDPDDIREPHLQRRGDFLGAFALIERQGRTLFVENQRNIGGRPTSVWDLPGGQVEPGELLVEALARELDEEIGVRLVGVPEMLFLQEGERRIGGQRAYAWRSFFFRVDCFDGEPRATADVLGHRWVDDADIDALLHAPYHDSFRSWRRDGGLLFRSHWSD